MWAVLLAASVASPVAAVGTADAGTTTIAVTTTVDGGPGSLRAAVEQANARGDAATIVLGAGQTYDLTDCSAGALTSHAGPLTITGNGSTLSQTCANAGAIDQEATTGLTIVGLRVTGVHVGGEVGVTALDGAVFSNGPLNLTSSTVTGTEGTTAVFSWGTTTITGSHIDGNTRGLWTSADAIVTSSTVSGNKESGILAILAVVLNLSHVDGSGGVRGRSVTLFASTVDNGTTGIVSETVANLTDSSVSGNDGPGVNAYRSATLVRSLVSHNRYWGDVGVAGGAVLLDRSTIADNKVYGDWASFSKFGFPFHPGAGVLGALVARSSTVTGNRGGWTGGVTGRASLTFATVADNDGAHTTALDVDDLESFGSIIRGGTSSAVPCRVTGRATSEGYNLEQGTDTCGFATQTDHPAGADPLLQPLADNGGATPTRSLQTGSIAHDAIPAGVAPCGEVDQRWVSRPQGDACDMGAVELRLPVAANGLARADAGVPVTTDLHALITDPDAWLTDASYALGTPPAHGTATTVGAGLIEYTPAVGYTGADQYGYTVCDNRNVTCLQAAVAVAVLGAPSSAPAAPLAARPSFTG